MQDNETILYGFDLNVCLVLQRRTTEGSLSCQIPQKRNKKPEDYAESIIKITDSPPEECTLVSTVWGLLVAPHWSPENWHHSLTYNHHLTLFEHSPWW